MIKNAIDKKQLLGNVIFISQQEQFIVTNLKGNPVRTITAAIHSLGIEMEGRPLVW